LLLPRPSHRAAFFHLSLQEFLSAERIARTADDRRALEQWFRNRGTVAEWRPTLLFLFAAQVFNYRDAQWGMELLTRLAGDQTRATVKANPAPAVFIAEALELCQAKGYRIPGALSDGFRQRCLDAIADEIELRARQALGLCLGRLGDPRIPDLRDPAAYVEVPPGSYPYGEKGDQTRIEAPFLLGRYPVTNSQYQAFMDAGGYRERGWWSDEGWAWLQESGISEPPAWKYPRWNGRNQPVVGVSFWEAEACCRWAGGRLPRDREWEAAARGPQGCEYPWCGPWEDGICNSREASLGVTSPVGLFPRSRQAGLGLEDLAGNVCEWCDDFAARLGADQPRVLRGGSSNHSSRFLRSAFRDWFEPGSRGLIIGFRCVLAPRRQP
jgi:hypothetical protein